MIGKEAFGECSSLGGEELPEGMERIEADAFSGCDALESLALPSTLKYIGDQAFDACRFYTVTILAGVETVGEFVFNYSSNLKSVTIQEASNEIKQGAFSRNRLSVCYTPSTVNWDDQAFAYTTEIVFTD